MNNKTERQQILEKVLVFLSKQLPDEKTGLDPSTRLSETALIDSIAMLEIIMFLEEDFGLTLSRADLRYIETPESITELILKKQMMAK